MVSNRLSLSAGVGPFPTRDHPRAFGIGVQVDQVSDLGDLGPIPQFPIGVDRGQPVDTCGDRGTDRFGDRHSDGEERAYTVLAQATDVAQEGVAGAGRVAAYEDVAAVPVHVGDLRHGQVQHLDVVIGSYPP
jgi:hypothetical protein